MLDELRQIAIFAKTVHHGSFRGAARALRLSPSVVSHHVSQLEKRLGTALLYRSTRKLSLTPDGERLLISAQTMIEAAELGLQEVSTRANMPSGTLRLTLPALLGQSDVTDQIARFALEYPQVLLSIDFTDLRRDLIADGYDIAFRAGVMQDSSLKARQLFKFNRRVVAAPGYIQSRAKPRSPEDLSDWHWIELSPVWRQKVVFKKNGRQKAISKLASRLSVNSAQALARLARAGTGVAIVPEFIAEPDVAAGKLIYVIPEWTIEPIKVFAVWPSNAPKNGLIKHFVTFMADNLQFTDSPRSSR